jgi:hypothetical protein
MYRIMLAAFIAALVVTFAAAKPIPPVPKQPAPEVKKLPDLEKLNPTNWGIIRQAGRNFTLTEHPVWEAQGVIREDGSISLLWTMLATGEPCPGEYEIADDDGKPFLQGVWGYSNEGEVKDGKTVGLPRPDRVYRVPPVEPDFK